MKALSKSRRILKSIQNLLFQANKESKIYKTLSSGVWEQFKSKNNLLTLGSEVKKTKSKIQGHEPVIKGVSSNAIFPSGLKRSKALSIGTIQLFGNLKLNNEDR